MATIRSAWGVSLYFIENVNPYPPLVNVSSHGWGHDLIAPVPNYVRPDPSGNGHMCLVDRITGEEWDFYIFGGSYPNLTSGNGRKIPGGVARDGVVPPASSSQWAPGCRESGFPLAAGLIRPEEIAAGEIRHALVLGNDGRNGWMQYVLPAATGCDHGFGPDGNGIAPMGARFQLKPDVDISGLTPAAQVVARALKIYGGYLGEEGDGQSLEIYMQTVGDEDNDGVPEFWDELWSGIWSDEDRASLATLTASDFRVLELPPLGR